MSEIRSKITQRIGILNVIGKTKYEQIKLGGEDTLFGYVTAKFSNSYYDDMNDRYHMVYDLEITPKDYFISPVQLAFDIWSKIKYFVEKFAVLESNRLSVSVVYNDKEYIYDYYLTDSSLPVLATDGIFEKLKEVAQDTINLPLPFEVNVVNVDYTETFNRYTALTLRITLEPKISSDGWDLAEYMGEFNSSSFGISNRKGLFSELLNFLEDGTITVIDDIELNY
jgi:hypothetical protein